MVSFPVFIIILTYYKLKQRKSFKMVNNVFDSLKDDKLWALCFNLFFLIRRMIIIAIIFGLVLYP